MIPDTLFDIALRFKKVKLWNRLHDTQLFAVRHSDGTLGYCCVMGMLGEHLALAVYCGETGLDSYRGIYLHSENIDLFDRHELGVMQDCVMVSFQNKRDLPKRDVDDINAYLKKRGLKLGGAKAYPQFERLLPCHYPWRLDAETDQIRMREALEAALEVSAKLERFMPESVGFADGADDGLVIPLIEKRDDGFVWRQTTLPPVREVVYDSLEITDDISLAKLKKCVARGNDWACDIFMHVEPVSDEGTDDPISAPYFPFVFILMDYKTSMICDMQPMRSLDDTTRMLMRMIEVASEIGKPSKIYVLNDRARAFLAHIAALLGAKIVKRRRIPMLESAKMSLVKRHDDFDDYIAEMFDALSDPASYPDLPDDMLRKLKQLAANVELSQEAALLLARECERRGI